MLPVASYFAIGLNVWSTGLHGLEAMAATYGVLARRSGMIGRAVNNPLDADLAEFSRFIPEKVEAFSRAGCAWWSDWWRLQQEVFDQLYDLMGLAFASWPPELRHTQRAIDRSGRIATIVSGTSGRVLAPIHKRVTANQKRLKRSARSR